MYQNVIADIYNFFLASTTELGIQRIKITK